jgi:hypothetical protein
VRGLIRRLILSGLLIVAGAAPSAAQAIDIKGYGMLGSMRFAASESFEAVLGSSSGFIFGGGAEVGLPLGGLYVGIGAWRFKDEGERVFISGNDEVFPLGIPVTVTVTPIEITGGWRFKNLSPRVVPYVGGGWSSFGYEEVSEVADAGEGEAERFSGFHLLGGAEVRVLRWLGVAGEIAWMSIPDALGTSGSASEHFDETNLGGTSLRLKITVGR